MRKLQGKLASTGDLATLLNVTPQRVRDLARDGIIPRATSDGGNRGGGLYPLGPSVRGYLRFLNRTPASTGKDALIQEQTRKLRMENEAQEENLVDAGAVGALYDAWMETIEGECEGFARRATRDRELRARLGREVVASQGRIRATMAATLHETLAGDAAEGLGSGPMKRLA